jgi:hypothetical protein
VGLLDPKWGYSVGKVIPVVLPKEIYEEVISRMVNIVFITLAFCE